MDIVETIKQAAARQGACAKIGRADGMAGLAAIFFSPQGKEFCSRLGFPPIEEFRGLKQAGADKHGVYVDFGAVAAENEENIALVGQTRGELSYSGPQRKHTVLLMHGAQARITLRGYAVAEVLAGEGCKADIDKDETSILL